MSIEEVYTRLSEQGDVLHTEIVEGDGEQFVKAMIANRLSDGTSYTRILYYNEHGTRVDVEE